MHLNAVARRAQNWFARQAIVLPALLLFAVLGQLLAAPAYAQSADLQVSAYTWAPDPVPNGALTTFDVRIGNNGPNAANNAVVTIAVAADFQVANNPGTAFPAYCALAGAVGSQTLTCTMNPFAVGANVTFQYKATARIVGAVATTVTIAPPAGVTDPNGSNDFLSRNPTVRTGVDLTVSKTADQASYPGGATVTYTLQPANAGPDSAASVRIVDQLPPPADLDTVTASGTNWNCVILNAAGPNPTAQCDYTGAAQTGNYPPITVRGRAARGIAGTITNSAFAQSNSASVLENTPGNDASGNVVVSVTPGANLAASKSMSSPLIAGLSATATLRIVNNGPATTNGAKIVDNMPADFTIGVLPAGCSRVGQVITCTAGSQVAGNTTSFVIPLTASATPNSGSNSATVSPPAGITDPVAGNDTTTVGYNIVPPYTDLSISKTKTPDPVSASGTLTSNITISNSGVSAANFAPGTPLVVTETIGVNERFTGVNTAGWSCSPAAPVDGPTTITCSTTGSGSIAVNGSRALQLTTTPIGITTDPYPTLTNTACTGPTAGSQHTPADNNASNDCGSANAVATNRDVDLSVVKDVGATSTGPWGQTLSVANATNTYYYRLTVSNAGPGIAPTVRLTDTLPEYLSSGSFTTGVAFSGPDAGACSHSGATLTCNLTYVGVGAGNAREIIVAVTRPVESGTFTNTATVSSPDTLDSNAANNSDTAVPTIAGVADVTITQKSINPSSIAVGVVARYTISYRNVGPDAADTVVLTDVLDATRFDFVGNITNTSPAGAGACSYNGGSNTLTCNIGTMNRGDTYQVAFDVRAKFPFGGATSGFPISHTNTANISTSTLESDAANDSGQVTHNVTAPALDLIVKKQEPVGGDPVDFGAEIIYLVTLQNDGLSRATNVSMVDTPSPPAGYTMTPVSYTIVAASTNTTGRTPVCTLNSPAAGQTTCVVDNNAAKDYLDAGEQVVVELHFTTAGADPTTPLTYSNNAAITSSETSVAGNDPNTGNNNVTETTTVLPVTDLQALAKRTITPSPVDINQPTTFEIDARNNGPSATPQFKIIDTLPPGFVLVGTPSAVGAGAANVTGTSCSGTSTVTCVVSGAFPSGAANVVTLSLVARPAYPYSGAIGSAVTNSASVAVAVDGLGNPMSRDPAAGNNVITSTVAVQAASLAGTVYSDTNGNNAFNAGEGINNVSITLTGPDIYGNTITTTVQTNASGAYTLSRLPPGSYEVYEPTQPAGYFDSTEFAGSAGGTASPSCPPAGNCGVARAQNHITAITLPAATAATGYNFQEVAQAQISGFVYIDANNDGQRGGGETGINGGSSPVTLRLTGTDYAGNAVNVTRTTNGSGAYSFTAQPPSDATGYTITEVNEPTGFVDGRDQNGAGAGSVIAGSAGRAVGETIVVGALIPAANLTERNFGELQAVTLAGIVYIDVNGDSTRQAGESAGVSGVTVALTGTNDLGQAINCSLTTNAAGNYSFPISGSPDPLCQTLRPGTYSLAETTPSGLTLTGAYSGSAGGGGQPANTPLPGQSTIGNITLASGVAGTNYNFGVTGQGIAGSVYIDRNGNGVRDPGEIGIAGVTVTLSGTSSGGQNVCTLISPSPCAVVTDASGNFQYLNLPASNGSGYTLTEQSQAAAPLAQFQDGQEAVGTVNGTVTGVAANDVISGIVIGNGQIGTGYTFGERAGSLGGFNYVDADNDGVFDAGETPLAGVTVTLSGTTSTGANVCTVLPSCVAVTAADGSYHFDDMPAGTFTLTQTQPANYSDGQESPGTVGGTPTGSAGAPGTSVISGIVMPVASAGVNYNFGETSAGLTGRVCLDVGNDACQAGDPGIGGVTITLSGVDGGGTPVNRTAVTAADGSYAFTNLPVPNGAGYTLTETQPAGYGSAALNTSVGTSGGVAANNVVTGIALPGTTNASGYNFGEVRADLSLTKTVSPTRQVIGQNVTFTITLTNSGPTAASGVAVTDALPAGLSFVNASAGPGTSFAGNTWTVGALANGATAALSITATVTTPGPWANTAQVSASNMPDPDSTPGNGLASEDDQATATVTPLATVTGHVFQDPNGNGVQDPGELPYVGVPVVVTDSSGTVQTVTTDSNGNYRADVAPGSTTLNVTDPAGVSLSTANDPQTVNVIAQPAPTPSAPVGFQPLGTISGSVFSDLNGNAIKDPGEPPYANQPVVITTSTGGTVTVNTDANGNYTVQVPAGTTSPNVTDPANTFLTTANDPQNVTVPIAGNGVATPVGFRPQGPDFVVTKTHLPGTFTENVQGAYTITVRNIGADSSFGSYTVVDTLPAGMTVAARPSGTNWDCSATVIGAAAASCSSAAVVAPGASTAPISLLVNVAAGSAARSPLVNTAAVSGGGEVAAVTNNNTVADSTPIQLAAGLSGAVWFDGGTTSRQRDPADRPLAGWIVELIDPALPPGSAPIRATVTDATGNYLIANVAPGTFNVRFRDPVSGVVFGTPVNGDNGNPQPGSVPAPGNTRGALQVTLVAGQTLPQQSLPVDPSGVVYDSVARTPVANAVVTLRPTGSCAGWDPSTQIVNAVAGGFTISGNAISMTTNASGFYQFLFGINAPASCAFELAVVPPAQYVAPSTLIPSSGTLTLPSGAGTVAVQPQATPATGSQRTTYYLNLVTGSAAQGLIHNHIPLDPRVNSILSIEKSVNEREAEIGDSVQYTLRVRNVQGATLPALVINDSLPLGFSYLRGSARVQLDAQPVTALADPAGGAGPRLAFSYGSTLAAGQTLTVTYRVRIGIGANNGDGINRAKAQSGVISSNEARAVVRVAGGVFTTEACVAGKIWVDCNENQVQDAEEVGVPGVRFYFEDGTWLVSDSEGKYSYCGLKPQTHVLKADRSTLPKGAYLGTTGSRNAGDPDSLFVDLKNGELHRADFRIASCTDAVLHQVYGRRTLGETVAPAVEKGAADKPDVTLDPRRETRCDLPRHATDPAYQGTAVDCPAASQEQRP